MLETNIIYIRDYFLEIIKYKKTIRIKHNTRQIKVLKEDLLRLYKDWSLPYKFKIIRMKNRGINIKPI